MRQFELKLSKCFLIFSYQSRISVLLNLIPQVTPQKKRFVWIHAPSYSCKDRIPGNGIWQVQIGPIVWHHCVVLLTLVELDISELVFTTSKDYEPSP